MNDEGKRDPNNKRPPDFGTGESTRQVFRFYTNQLAVLRDLTESSQVNEASGRISSLYPLLFSIRSTALSISILARHGCLNECFMLTRAFLERLVNYIYLLICEEDEYQRYLTHTKQKGFRALNRAIQAGDMRAELKWSGSVDLSKELELKEAIDLFTSKTGREINRWTSATLSERLASIAERGQLNIGPLLIGLLAIYGDSSEALHGTLYGCIFHMGVFTGKFPSTKDELGKTYNQQFSMLFLILGICIDSLVEAVHRILPVHELHTLSTQNVDSVAGGKWLPEHD